MPTLPDIAAPAGVVLNLKLAANGDKGPEYHGPCPGCGGEDRFHVWPEQHPGRGGSYWCRQCGKAGDGIQFLRDFGGLTFKDACSAIGKELDDKFNSKSFRAPWKSTPILPKTPVPGLRRGSEMKPRECEEPPLKWQIQARKYIDQGNTALMSNPAALEKLERERGITPATAQSFNLGLLLPRPGGRLPCRFSSRALWGLPPKTGAKKPDSLWLPRGLIIPATNINQVNETDTPIVNATADQVSGFSRIRIRRPALDIVNGGSKYFIIPGSGMAPLLLLDQQPAVVVVESELDAILIYQEVGALCGVLALGNSSARPDHTTAARLNELPLLVLAFDNDPAGDEAADRWQQWYSHTERLILPAGIKDPGELHQSGADLKEWIIMALPSPWRTPPRSTTITAGPVNISASVPLAPAIKTDQTITTSRPASKPCTQAPEPYTQAEIQPDSTDWGTVNSETQPAKNLEFMTF